MLGAALGTPTVLQGQRCQALPHKPNSSRCQNHSQRRCEPGATVTIVSPFLPAFRGGAQGQGRSFPTAAWSGRRGAGQTWAEVPAGPRKVQN